MQITNTPKTNQDKSLSQEQQEQQEPSRDISLSQEQSVLQSPKSHSQEQQEQQEPSRDISLSQEQSVLQSPKSHSQEENTLPERYRCYLTGKGYRASTVRGRVGAVRSYLVWLAAENIAPEAAVYRDIVAYTEHCRRRGHSTRTLNCTLQALEHYYTMLEGRGLVASNPVQGLRIRGAVRHAPPPALDAAVLAAAYRAYPSHGLHGARNKSLAGLLLFQGLHSGEVGALRVPDVDLEAGRLHVPATGRSNARHIAFAPEQMLTLQRYLLAGRPALLAQRGVPSDTLLLSSGGSDRSSTLVYRVVRHLHKLDARITSAAQIRASVISAWIRVHGLRRAQYLAGHRYPSSTERYAGSRLEELQERIAALHPLNQED